MVHFLERVNILKKCEMRKIFAKIFLISHFFRIKHILNEFEMM